MGMGGRRHAPAALPPGKTRYPLYRRLGGLQGRSGGVQKISPAPGFDPRTAQPVATRCAFVRQTCFWRCYFRISILAKPPQISWFLILPCCVCKEGCANVATTVTLQNLCSWICTYTMQIGAHILPCIEPPSLCVSYQCSASSLFSLTPDPRTGRKYNLV